MSQPCKIPSAAGAVDILLLEDNRSYIELTRRALSEIAGDDLRVAFACDGMQAMNLLSDIGFSPQLIISDINMPKMGGFDFLRLLRAIPSRQYLPVVMLSSSNRAEDVTESYRLGANGYVMRPMNFEGYIKMLSDIIAYWLVINVPVSRPFLRP